MHRRMLIAVLSLAALLVAPAAASATTEVRTQQIQGLDDVVAVDDGGSAQIETAQGTDPGPPQQNFVVVRNAGGATPATGCRTFDATTVVCFGNLHAIVGVVADTAA